jgi:hypothetical protein
MKTSDRERRFAIMPVKLRSSRNSEVFPRYLSLVFRLYPGERTA